MCKVCGVDPCAPICALARGSRAKAIHDHREELARNNLYQYRSDLRQMEYPHGQEAKKKVQPK